MTPDATPETVAAALAELMDRMPTLGAHGLGVFEGHRLPLAELFIGYSTNDAFISAAILAGYPYRCEPGSPNVLLGMSERSLRRLGGAQ